MARVALAFAYDGTAFDSFARQPSRRTVEGELIAALVHAGAFADPRQARFAVASRTDARVSAWLNVCAFESDADVRALAPRARTPDGLWIRSAIVVPDRFHPRTEARSRTYRYGLPPLSGVQRARLERAAALLVGPHEFRLLCRREPGQVTRRSIDRVEIVDEDGALQLRLQAASFLWEQVRRVAHALLAVAARERTLADWRRQLEGRGTPEPPAAPEPLVLEDVDVGFTFPPPSAAASRRLASVVDSAWARWRFYAGLASSGPTVRR